MIAAILGCGTGTLRFIDAGGQTFVPHFAYVVNSSPDCGSCTPQSISAFAINSTTGALTPVPGSPFVTATSGGGNMIVDVDPGSHFLFVPTRQSNSVQVFSINSTTGALTEVSGSPFGSGGSDAYAVEIDASGKFLYVSHRTSGTIAAFTIGANGALTAVGSPVETVGSARHLGIHKGGKFLYASVFTEGYVVQGYAINSSSGALTEVPNSPTGTGNCPKGLETDFSGQFLIVPNNCDDTISVFKIDQTTGALTEVSGSPFSGAEQPMSVTEAMVGNQAYIGVSNVSGNISVFSFNTSTGALTPVSGSPFTLGMSRPHWIEVAGNFAYAVDQNSDNIRGATLSSTGTPTEITGSPFSGGGLTNPSQIVIAY